MDRSRPRITLPAIGLHRLVENDFLVPMTGNFSAYSFRFFQMRKHRNGHRNRNFQKLPEFNQIQPGIIDHQKDLLLANHWWMRSAMVRYRTTAPAQEKKR